LRLSQAAGISQAPRFKWQALFILYGGITITLGVWAFFFLPASPTECNFLTEREKVIALERVRSNKTGSEAWKFNKEQLKEYVVTSRNLFALAAWLAG
jgi:ACS family allantoate permease-like MFS transporter